MMRHSLVKTGIELFFICALILGCGGKMNIKAPPVDVHKNILSKGVKDNGYFSRPYEETDIFYSYDYEVYSFLEVVNIAGDRFIRWDWIRPDGELYYSTGNKLIRTNPGYYKKYNAIWHSLYLLGDKAVEYPGQWKVNIYLDDEPLASNQFMLEDEVNIERMPYNTKETSKKKWGLVIGLEEYSMLPKAAYAKKDALLARDYFVNILGVPQENLIQLYNNDATKTRIEGFLESYFPKNIDSDAILYVFFAGHGLPSLNKSDAYLATYDCDVRFIEHSSYKLTDFYQAINDLEIKQAFVFIDSCFSGVALRGDEALIKGSRPVLIHMENKEYPFEKVISMNSSRMDQISNAYDEKEHGLFSYFLLKGIRGPADENLDNEITLNELFDYVKFNVSKISRRKGVPQIPFLIHRNRYLERIVVADVLK